MSTIDKILIVTDLMVYCIIGAALITFLYASYKLIKNSKTDEN